MRDLVVVLALSFAAAPASAQSLADVAKKEKERREENEKAGRKAVIEAEGAGAVPSEPPPPEAEADESDAQAPAVEALAEQPTEAEQRREPIEEPAADGEDPDDEPAPPDHQAAERAEAEEIAIRMKSVMMNHESAVRSCDDELERAQARGGLVIDDCPRAKRLADEYSELRKRLFALEGSAMSTRRLPTRLRR